MPFQYNGNIRHWELEENRETPKNYTFVIKYYFVKMFTWATNMNFTITSPKTSVAPLSIMGDSKTYLSQSEAL